MADWTTTNPIDSLLISSIPAAIRDVNIAIETMLEREHFDIFGAIGPSMSGGYHVQGSARCFYRTTAPTTKYDGTAFNAADLGSMFIHTDDTVGNTFYILTGITPTTWTPISTAIIATLLAADRTFLEKLKSTKDFSVGSDTMTVAAASGNTTIAGKITANGGITLKSDDSQLIEHVKNPVGAQDAATKKFVDDIITGLDYTSIVTVDSLGNAIAIGSTYLSNYECVVYVIPTSASSNDPQVTGYIGSSVVGLTEVSRMNDFDSFQQSIMMVVPKGWYFRITTATSTVATIRVILRGSGTIVKQ